MNKIAKGSSFALALALFCAMQANADDFNVSLNTSSLSGPQTIVFGLFDGDQSVDNSVSLSAFNFGTGSALGSPDDLGTSGVSGNLAGTVSLDDSGFTALFSQEFNPGSKLSFALNTTNNFAGTAPDALAFYVCDTSLNCYSDDAVKGDLLELDLTGNPLSPSSFILNGASAQGLPAPVVTYPTNTTTPEPASALLLLLGLLLAAPVAWKLYGNKQVVARFM
jgi:hypothetical protein